MTATQSELIAAYMELFARCEAMRPKHIRCCTTEPHYAMLVMPGMDHGTGCDGAASDCVLALCRCAVEDWLMAQFGREDYCSLIIQTRDGGWNGGNFIVEITRFAGQFGPTIHEALISAASTVLDKEAGDA